MKLRTCVHPDGKFICGKHRPRYHVENFRENDHIDSLGNFEDGSPYLNRDNFPAASKEEKQGGGVYEIPNPFPFRGTTYIAEKWADDKAADPASITLPQPRTVSFSDMVKKWFGEKGFSSDKLDEIFGSMPEPLLLALASSSTDPDDIVRLAELCCEFVYDDRKRPTGLRYHKNAHGKIRPRIHNKPLYEVLANNQFLPDKYKEIMVLRPGVQGDSPIVGEWMNRNGGSHVFEYLRSNSYIPWGHFAANMANTAVRYRIAQLGLDDMTGMRALYYRRIYAGMAEQLGLKRAFKAKTPSEEELEELRLEINRALASEDRKLKFTRSLWGWNFGFDFAPSHYRLHASHQQIHQQFAFVPSKVALVGSEKRNAEGVEDGIDDLKGGESMESYACGDLIEDFVGEYRRRTGKNFFERYIKAMRNNVRTDLREDKPDSLIVYEDRKTMIFVPKAQTSQWELQLMTLSPTGNILEADADLRRSLDRAILTAVKILESLGARMITSIEFSKAFDSSEADQHLLYSFLPKLPESPGAFSEAQLRWINGHYPEDFAWACRAKLPSVLEDIDRGGSL